MSVHEMKDSLLSDTSERHYHSPLNIFSWLASKFTAGSIKGSILELISATIGAGVLTLPYAFGRSGLILSLIQVLACAALGFYSTRLLSKCGDMAKRYSYPELAAATYGPLFQFFVKLIFFLNNWGGCVIYTILITNLVGTALGIFLPNLPSYLTDTNSLFWPPVYTTVIILPLALNRDLSALRYACLTGFLFIMYLAVVIIFESNNVANLSENFKNSVSFDFTGVNITFPTIVFSYSCHPNVLDVYHELQRSSMRRMTKVLFRAMLVACVVFMLVGSFGYLTFVDNMYDLNCPQNVLLSFQYRGWPVPTIVALLCIGLTIVLAMPLSIKPSKDALRELLFGKYVKAGDLSGLEEKVTALSSYDHEHKPEKKKDSTKLHVCLVLFVVYSQMLCGMFIQSMESVITLLGASAYPLICYIFPCLFFLKLDKSRWNSPERLFCHFVNISMCLLAIYCTYQFFAVNTNFC